MKTNLFKRILKHFGITLVIVSLLYSNTNTYLIFIPKIQTASAATWYNTSWLYRIKITVNHTKVAANLTDFPVYVDLANMPVAFFTHVKAGGADIRITTSDKVTEVPVEIVDIDTGAKTGELHFKAPSLSSSIDTDFYIYYGNASASAYSVTATYGRNNVWANYTRVGHGNETAIVDSTGNAANGTPYNSPTIISGKIGKAISFNGTNQYINVPFYSGIEIRNRTISGWIKQNGASLGAFSHAVDLGSQYSYNSQTGLHVPNNATWGLRGFAGGGNYGYKDTATHMGVWGYVVGVLSYNPTTEVLTASLYIDGNLISPPSIKNGLTVFEAVSDLIQIGAEKTNLNRYFNGSVDEYRLIEDVSLTTTWIKTEYNNQSSPSTFYNINTEEIYNSNTAPTITSSSDSPDPVDAGQNITFSVGFTDADGDGVKTYICKTASFTAGVGCNGGTWAKQDSSFSTTTPQNMTYTTTLSDVAINDYYPFIEDSNGASASGTASTFTVKTPWYDTSWANRIKITVNHTKVAANLTDFPVYVDLNDLPDAFFSNVKADGGDIRITTSDGSTEVPVEIVAIDTSAKTGELHFKAPSLSSSVDTDFYIYYKNASATMPSVSSTYGRNNVWSEYSAVYHMTEGNAVDSTGNGHTGTNTGTTDTAGKLGRGRYFNKGTTTKITLDTTVMSDDTSTPLTVSAWVHTDSLSSAMKIVNRASMSGVGGLQFGITSTGEWLWFLRDSGGTNSNHLTTPTEGAGYTRYVVGTYSGNKLVSGMKLYKDGVDVGSVGSSSTLGSSFGTSSYNVWIGNRESIAQPWDGFIDEVRIAQVNRNSSWVSTEYNNQNSASTFYTVGSEEGTAPSGTLSVDIVDSGGSSVTSPSITLSPIDFSFSEQTSNGTFGTSDEKIHIDNNTSTATWSVSIAPNDGSTALWQGASNQYDFNDTSLSANDDDSDADSVGGKMTIDPTVSTITPASGCGLTNISTGGNASFAEGSTDSITLASATTGANTTCSWDITGIGISQTIPAEQPADSYSIDMTLSIIAS